MGPRCLLHGTASHRGLCSSHSSAMLLSHPRCHFAGHSCSPVQAANFGSICVVPSLPPAEYRGPRFMAAYTQVSKDRSAQNRGFSTLTQRTAGMGPSRKLLGTILPSFGSDIASPLGLQGRAASQRGLFYSRKILWNLPCLDLLETHYSFPLSHFSLLEWECIVQACSTVVYWKHITRLVSQVHSWRGICLRMNCTLGLTHV